MTVHEHVCVGTWQARSHARFWEPGVEDWARERLHLPEGTHVTAGMLDSLRVAPGREVDGPVPGNRLVTVGLAALTNQLKNGTQAWAATSGTTGFVALAVGTDTTTDAIGNADITGASKSYRVCDVGFPTVTNGVMRFFTTFASAEANFVWDEYGVIVPSSGAVAMSTTAAVTTKPVNYTLLNRKAPAGLGSKSAGGTASLDLSITIV